jgi:hypothetical protein
VEFLQIWGPALKSRYEFGAQKRQNIFIGAPIFFTGARPRSLRPCRGGNIHPPQVKSPPNLIKNPSNRKKKSTQNLLINFSLNFSRKLLLFFQTFINFPFYCKRKQKKILLIISRKRMSFNQRIFFLSLIWME